MRLTDRQMAELSTAQQADFRRRCAACLRAAFLSATRSLDDDALSATIDAAIERCRTLNIRAERDVHAFIELRLEFGPKFEDGPATPWAPPILNETALGSAVRLDLLLAAALWQLRRKGAKTIAPSDLRPTAVQVANDALWRARPYLHRRRLSLGEPDQAECTDWLRAYETALLGVAPELASRAEPPAGSIPSAPPSSDHPVGCPVTSRATPVFECFDIVCWNALTTAVARSPQCLSALDRWLIERLPESQRRVDVTWSQIAAAPRAGDPTSPSTSARIALVTADAVRRAGSVWVRQAEPVSRIRPHEQSATALVLASGEHWVFDWYTTLDPYNPRVVRYEQWVEGA